MYKSKRSNACDITPSTKKIVWERDEHRCVLCGSSQAMPNAHYISRAKGGLGIPQNIVTLCQKCHYLYDNTPMREEIKMVLQKYFKRQYINWNEEELTFKK